MRWVFWALLLANLAVFLWATGHRPPTPQSQPRPPIQAEKMALRPPAKDRPDEAGQARSCYAVGPFATTSQVEFAADYLRQLGLAYRVQQRGEEVVEGYRVLVGPFPDPQAAEAAYRRLGARGLRGHYVIRRGQEHAVALGFFTELSKAERYVAQLRAKGIEAFIRVRTGRGGHRYWLHVGPVEGGGLMPRLQSLDWGVHQARVLSRPCPVEP